MSALGILTSNTLKNGWRSNLIFQTLGVWHTYIRKQSSHVQNKKKTRFTWRFLPQKNIMIPTRYAFFSLLIAILKNMLCLICRDDCGKHCVTLFIIIYDWLFDNCNINLITFQTMQGSWLSFVGANSLWKSANVNWTCTSPWELLFLNFSTIGTCLFPSFKKSCNSCMYYIQAIIA